MVGREKNGKGTVEAFMIIIKKKITEKGYTRKINLQQKHKKSILKKNVFFLHVYLCVVACFIFAIVSMFVMNFVSAFPHSSS